MSDVKRSVMKFFVPTQVVDLLQSGFNRGNREEVIFYVSPAEFKIQEKKLIEKKLTKGGYVVQYWGEDLPVITASGTTGSGGIEAINILRDVYRHEQIIFENLLIQRGKDFTDDAIEAFEDVPTNSAQIGTTTVLDAVTGGGFSSFVDGAKSAIQSVTDAFNGVTGASSFIGPHDTFELPPSTGAFAISIDLYFQKEKFRGYFQDFSVSESASRPGHFDYSFTFNVTKRAGKRKNFMPWHRKPTTRGGFARTASIPLEGPKERELSHESTQEAISDPRTNFKTPGDQDRRTVPINNVGVNRRKRGSGEG